MKFFLIFDCRYLSNCDAWSGYWNIPLDEEIQCTFLRLPFGICSLKDIFQMQIDTIFSPIPDVYIITDDNLIANKRQEGNDRAIQHIITTCREVGAFLNGDKCHLLKDKIK